MAKKFEVSIGDRVAYSVQFLRSTGLAHSPAAHAKGTVTSVKRYGSNFTLAEITWENGADMPERVAVFNLAKVGPNSRFAAC